MRRRHAIFAAALATLGSFAHADTSATWNGSTSNWSNAADWSLPNYPDNGTPAGALYDVTISAGNVTLDVSPTVQTFNFSGGTLTGSNDLNVASSMTWANSASLNGTGTVTTQDLSINLINAHVFMNNSRALVSTGSANWTSNGGFDVFLNSGNSYTNDGTFTINTTGGAGFSGGTFNNAGSLNKISSDSNIISSTFNNSGSVNVSAGTLTLSGGGTQTGSFTTTAGGILKFQGTHAFNSGATISGGNIVFAAGTSTFNPGSSYNPSGGTTTTISSGTVNFVSGGTMSVGDTLDLNGGTLGGTDDLTVANSMSWSNSGTLSGTGTVTTKDLNISLVNAHVFMSSSRALVSTGAANWTSNGGFDVFLGSSNSYTNKGTFTINTVNGAGFSGGTFNNPGSLLKTSSDTNNISSAFNNTGSVTVSAGTLTLSGGGTHTGTFTTTGSGLVSFQGTHNFNSGSSISAGSINFTSGTDNFNTGSTFAASTGTSTTISGATINFLSGTTQSLGDSLSFIGGTIAGTDNLTVGSSMTWANSATLSGTGSLTTKDLTISLVNAHVFMSQNRSLISTGAATWTSNGGFDIFLNSNNSYTNDGTFSINTTGNPSFSGGTFNNAGTLTKTSSDTNTISSFFNNSGTVSVSAGTLSLSSGGTQTGLFETSGTGAINFAGTHNFNSGSTVAAGTFSFSSGTTNFNSGCLFNNSATTTVNGATVNLNSGVNISSLASTLNISSGQLNLNSGANPSITNFNMTGGSLGGTDNLTVTDSTTWSGGGTLGGTGSVTTKDLSISLINNHVFMSGSRSLISTGSANWTSNGGFSVLLSGGNTYTNEGTFTINTAGGAGFSGGTFNNSGTLTKVSSDTNAVSSIFNNSGTVSVSAGTLNFTGGGTHTGTFTNSGSGNISFSGTHNFNSGAAVTLSGINLASGTDNFNTGSSYDPAGTTSTTISGATVNFNTGGIVNLGSSLSLVGGTLQGNDNLTAAAMTWTNSTLSGTGTLTTQDLTINLFNSHVFMNGSRSLVSTGTSTWTSNGGFSVLLGGGNTYTNQGSLNINTTGNANFSGGVFNNSGSITKTSTDTNTISSHFNNSGNVTVSAGTLAFSGLFTQTAGEINLAGGSISTSFTMDFQGGTLTGSGTIRGAIQLDNDPATLAIDLGGETPGSGYDQINITAGNATLGGDLSINFTNNFQNAISAGDTFTVLTVDSTNQLIGSFLNVADGGRLETTDGFGSFQVNYGSGPDLHEVVLSNFVATPVPEPTTIGLTTLLAASLAGRSRSRKRK